MSLYSRLKDSISEKYPNVMYEYSEWIIANGNNTLLRKLRGYVYLLNLITRHNKRKITIINGEYADSKRKDIDKYIKEVLDYDVISFDIFDTLILRKVENPEDVFELVGNKLKISAFAKARKQVEQELWEKKGYNIFDIYDKLSLLRNIGKESWKTEFDVERAVCCANPFMLQIYNAAISAGKKVIAVSDMYWPKDCIEQILKDNGYNEISEIYVSCDIGKSKCDGELYKWLLNQNYDHHSMLHIGDNYNSDIYQARKKGIKALQYVSVREHGAKYRVQSIEKKPIGLSVSNAIINNKIHNGICGLDQYMQYGYIYGGILIKNYCQFIHTTVYEKKIDKLLFLSRDAEVVYKAYQSIYVEQCAEYVYASRNAVAKLAFERYPDYFIEQVINLRFISNTNSYRVEEVLEQTGLQCLKKHLKEVNIDDKQLFTNEVSEQIKNLIYQYKNNIVEAFKPFREAASIYWNNVVGNSKKIALIDIGWQGTTHMCLDYFLRHVCSIECEIYTIQLATVRSKWCDVLFDKGYLVSYCFSSEFNKAYLEKVMFSEQRKSLIEIMFTSTKATLIDYVLDENDKVKLNFAKQLEGNIDVTNKIQQGILEYVDELKNVEKNLGLSLFVCGEDAFKPLYYVTSQKKYMYRLFKNYQYSNIPCDTDVKAVANIL